MGLKEIVNNIGLRQYNFRQNHFYKWLSFSFFYLFIYTAIVCFVFWFLSQSLVETQVYIFIYPIAVLLFFFWIWLNMLSTGNIGNMSLTEGERADYKIQENEVKRLRKLLHSSRIGIHLIANIQSHIYEHILFAKKALPNQTEESKQIFEDLRLYCQQLRIFQLAVEDEGKLSIPIAKELEYVKCYLNLIKMGEFPDLSYEIPDLTTMNAETLQLNIPKTSLVTFIVNACVHGIYHKPQQKGHISLRYKEEANSISFIIEDDGVGLAEGKRLSATKTSAISSNGKGIAYIKDIFETRFHDHKQNKLIGPNNILNENGEVIGTIVTLQFQKKDLRIVQ